MIIKMFDRLSISAAVAAGLLAAFPAATANAASFSRMERVERPSFERFSVFSVRIDEFGAGPGGDFQIVLTVRNDTNEKQGLNSNDLDLAVISASNEPRTDDGNMYDGRASGSLATLTPLARTIWLEPRQEARVRFGIYNSRGFAPTRLQVRETKKTEGVVFYAIQ